MSMAEATARAQETRAPEIISALTVCPAVAAVFVMMRIYTRVVLVKRYFVEDYSIVAALVCTIAMSIFMGLSVKHGAGRHIETVSKADLEGLSKVGIGTIQFYALTHFFLKLSIMLQYYRVAILPWEKNLCLGIIATLSAGYAAVLIVEMVRCVPFEAQWNPSYQGAKCINSTAFYFSTQGLNMLMDLVILLGPLVILRHSAAPLPQRLLFGVALAFGGIACIVSALRFQTLHPSTTSTDPTWDKTPSGFYGVIEANLGITCACVVTLRPLFHQIRLSLLGSKQQSTADNMPDQPRGRASFYHITLSSVDRTLVSENQGDAEPRGVHTYAGFTEGGGRSPGFKPSSLH